MAGGLSGIPSDNRNHYSTFAFEAGGPEMAGVSE